METVPAEFPPAVAGDRAGALALYAREHRGVLAEQTVRETIRLVEDLCGHAGCGPAEITRDHVVAALDHWATHGRRHRLADGTVTRRRTKAGAKTRRTYLSAIRAVFGWMIETERRRGPNPCETVRSPRVLKRQHRAFTIDEVRRLLAAAPPELAAFLRTAYITGIRVGALARMPTSAFVLVADEPRIEVPAELAKSRREYSAALDDETAAILRRLLEQRGPDHRPNQPLFDGRSPAKLRKRFRTLCRRAGIALVDSKGRGVELRCLRRTTASRMIDLGSDPKVAQMQLGHASVATTLDNYVDRDLNDQRHAAESLGRAVESGIPGDTGTDEAGENFSTITPAGLTRTGVEGHHLARHAGPAHAKSPAKEPRPRNDRVRGGCDDQPSKGPDRGRGSSAVNERVRARRASQDSKKWAILDSNRYAPDEGDIPPRLSRLLGRVLDVLETELTTRTGWSPPDAEEPPCPD